MTEDLVHRRHGFSRRPGTNHDDIQWFLGSPKHLATEECSDPVDRLEIAALEAAPLEQKELRGRMPSMSGRRREPGRDDTLNQPATEVPPKMKHLS